METAHPASDGRAAGADEAAGPQGVDPAAKIAAWREAGADRFDPVRLCFIEALARRTATHQGPARRVLDAKLNRLLAAYEKDFEQTSGTRPTTQPRPPNRGALADLIDHAARHAPLQAGGAERELKALTYFRSTWSRLSADQWLTQSLAQVPPNAGPLHSQHLVHRSIALMRDLSPEYLDRFMSYVDALLWLEQASEEGGVSGKDAPVAESGRKAGRGRAA